MKVINLKLNEEITKTELCELLGIKKASGGRNVKLQDEEIARYIKIEKVSRYKIKVAEIYESVAEKIDNRKGNSGTSEGSRNNNNPYGKYIDLILKEYIVNAKKTKFYVTTNILAKEFGLVNYNYSVASANKRKYFQYSYKEVNGEVNKTSMWDTFGIIKGVLKGVVRSSLDRIANTGIITYKEAYIVIFNNNTRIATAKETTKQKMQFNDKLRNKYYMDVEKLVSKRLDNYTKHFVGYEINKLKNIKPETTIEDIEALKENVNRIFKNRINESLTKIHNKTNTDAKIKYPKWIGTVNPSWDIWTKNRISITYLYYAKYILDSLTGLNYKNISKDIEDTNVIEYMQKGEPINFNKLNTNEVLEIYNRATDKETKEIISLYHMETNDLPY